MIKIAEENETPEETTPEEPEQVKPHVGDSISIQDARDVAARMEAANKDRREILEREEALMSQRIISGKSDAGQAPEPKKELTPEEYTNKILEGEKPPK